MVKCRDCKFLEENFITSLQGQGIYRFGYCARVVYDCRMVEPDIDRECEWHEEKDDRDKATGAFPG